MKKRKREHSTQYGEKSWVCTKYNSYLYYILQCHPAHLHYPAFQRNVDTITVSDNLKIPIAQNLTFNEQYVTFLKQDRFPDNFSLVL